MTSLRSVINYQILQILKFSFKMALFFLAPTFFLGCAVTPKPGSGIASRCLNLSKDLNYIHESISQNFSGYIHSPALKASTDAIFALEIAAAPRCQSEKDYIRSIRKYLAAFKDPHVKASWFGVSKYGPLVGVSSGKKLDPNQKEIPNFATGIYLINYSGRFFVKDIDPDLKDTKVKVGDELKACNGNSVSQILQREILPYESVSAYDASYYRMTSNVFVRWDQTAGSIVSCDFIRGSNNFVENFVWKVVPENYVEVKFQKCPNKIYEIEEIPNGHWVKLNSFSGYNEDGIRQLKLFSEDAKKLRRDRIVVMDVRGNSGGNSSWGTDWIDNLFGYHEDPKEVHSWILVSEGNRGHFERLYNHLSKNNGVTTSTQNHWKKLLTALKTQPGRLVEINDDDSKTRTKKSKKTGFKGKVYVLTDYMVFSSGETFVEQLKMMPNVIQAGIATNASTYYSDIRFDITPGGLVFNFPTMVDINASSKRASGEALLPEIKLSSDPERELRGRDSMREDLLEIIGRK